MNPSKKKSSEKGETEPDVMRANFDAISSCLLPDKRSGGSKTLMMRVVFVHYSAQTRVFRRDGQVH